MYLEYHLDLNKFRKPTCTDTQQCKITSKFANQNVPYPIISYCLVVFLSK